MVQASVMANQIRFSHPPLKSADSLMGREGRPAGRLLRGETALLWRCRLQGAKHKYEYDRTPHPSQKHAFKGRLSLSTPIYMKVPAVVNE